MENNIEGIFVLLLMVFSYQKNAGIKARENRLTCIELGSHSLFRLMFFFLEFFYLFLMDLKFWNLNQFEKKIAWAVKFWILYWYLKLLTLISCSSRLIIYIIGVWFLEIMIDTKFTRHSLNLLTVNQSLDTLDCMK